MKLLKICVTFFLGVYEFRRSWTWADPLRSDLDPYTDLDHAYDSGRDFAHRFTLRRFEA